MKKFRSIKDLTDAGYLVSIIHHRRYKIARLINQKIVVSRPRLCEKIPANALSELLTTGGMTVVSAVDPKSNMIFVGRCRCHSRQNYDKKRGTKVAGARVVKQINGTVFV